MTGTTIPGAAPSRRGAAMAARAALVMIGIATLVTLSLAFDARLAETAAGLPLDAIAWGEFLSSLGKSGYMFAISGLITVAAFALRARPEQQRHALALTLLGERAAYVFCVLSVSGLAAQVIKHIVGRARPTMFRAFGPYHFDVLSMKNSLASFPSGHTTTVFAMAVALSPLCPKLRVALFTLAAAIAVSRIVVQAHYLSDVASGAVLGSASALLVAAVFARCRMAFVVDGRGLHVKDPGAIAAAFIR